MVMAKIFPIGDLHIESMEQSRVFAEYLNQRPEDVVVLLGDVIHFANSIWSPQEVPEAERVRALEEDISIWEDFVSRLSISTIYYFGSHEMFALGVIKRLLPSKKLRLNTRFVLIPDNFQAIRLGPGDDVAYVMGIHVPDNIHPDVKSREFLERKRMIEEWLSKKVQGLKVEEPGRTVLCTHDPCDAHYRNLGYGALTRMLQKWPFKVHYHAHIHSNLRRVVVGVTPSVNRSFIALAKFEPKALEPAIDEIKKLYGRKI